LLLVPLPLPIVHQPDQTVRVTPLDAALLAGEERRSFATDFVVTLKRFAIPLAALVVLAIAIGGYFAFASREGTSRAEARMAPATAKTETTNKTTTKETTKTAKTTKATLIPTVTPITGIQVTPIDEPTPTVSAVMASKLAVAQAKETMELAKGAVVVVAPKPAPGDGGVKSESVQPQHEVRKPSTSPASKREVSTRKRPASARKLAKTRP
jgi:hypothetical protein